MEEPKTILEWIAGINSQVNSFVWGPPLLMALFWGRPVPDVPDRVHSVRADWYLVPGDDSEDIPPCRPKMRRVRSLERQ